MIKAVILDFDDTLVDYKHWLHNRYVKLGNWVENEFGIKGFDDAIWDKVNHTSIYYTKLINHVCNQLNVPYYQTERIQTKFNSINASDVLLPNSVELLTYLHTKYKLGIITNGWKSTHEQRLIKTNTHHFFNHITYGYEDKAKPATDPYMECINKLEVKPNECIMIGDNIPRDLATASKLGMFTILIDHIYRYPSKHPQVDLYVNRYDQLLKLFKTGRLTMYTRDTIDKDHIICPFCGNELIDAYGCKNELTTCQICGRMIKIETKRTIKYSTYIEEQI